MSPDEPSEIDWTVVKAIIDAQSHANTSLEQYLLYVTHDEFDLNHEEIETCLEDAIHGHERAIDDLRTAKATLNGEDCEDYEARETPEDR
ncbi:hypothetical protein ACFQAS_03315 [Halopenitus salinus]|uniref:DUF8103 domain-containing protein n=1 Tax=Halopenitus salinus TaxID=1198295 RepID=A0ABD5UQF5_9EURY